MDSLNLHRTSCFLVSALFLAVGLLTGPSGSGREARATAVEVPAAAPGSGGVAAAQQTTTVLAGALVAGIANISDTVPPGAPAADVVAGSAAVSALLPKGHAPYALLDASGSPLDSDNFPRGSFESNGLAALVGGAPVVQQVVGGQLRTLVPLTSDMHPNCATCHSNYSALAPGTVVGAASFRIGL